MQEERTCACGCGEIPRSGNRFIKGHNARLSVEHRIRYTVASDGCWIWQGRIGRYGYGLVWNNRAKRDDQAHRAVYEQVVGAVPEGFDLDHLCHDRETCSGGPTCPHRACVNPAHLQPVSLATNCRRGSATKLTWDDVRAIRRSTEPYRALARRFGVSSPAISNIKNHKRWREGLDREWTGASTDG